MRGWRRRGAAVHGSRARARAALPRPRPQRAMVSRALLALLALAPLAAAQSCPVKFAGPAYGIQYPSPQLTTQIFVTGGTNAAADPANLAQCAAACCVSASCTMWNYCPYTSTPGVCEWLPNLCRPHCPRAVS